MTAQEFYIAYRRAATIQNFDLQPWHDLPASVKRIWERFAKERVIYEWEIERAKARGPMI